eukprot:scaffold3177_cov108-Isochrysis_galbana.AAC.1
MRDWADTSPPWLGAQSPRQLESSESSRHPRRATTSVIVWRPAWVPLRRASLRASSDIPDITERSVVTILRMAATGGWDHGSIYPLARASCVRATHASPSSGSGMGFLRFRLAGGD